MSRGWWARIQLILALVMVFGASPLAATAQVATPVPGSEPPVVEDEAPVVDEETPVDSGVDTPEARTPAQDTGEQDITPAQVEGVAIIEFGISECENDDLAGTIDFLALQGVAGRAAGNTSENCAAIGPDAYVEMYIYDPVTEGFIVVDQDVMEVPAGTYIMVAFINDTYGESVPIEFPEGSQTSIAAVSYTPSTPREVVDGVGSVDVIAMECVNWERAGDMDFLVGPMMGARSTSTDCAFGTSTPLSFTLVNADDPAQVLRPDVESDPVSSFAEVPAGTWYLEESTTGLTSQPFTVSGEQGYTVNAILYVEGLIDLSIEKIYCENDARAGTTEFVLDTPPSIYEPFETGTTCSSVAPEGEAATVNVTLENLDTGASYRVELAGEAVSLESIEPGTYTATESDGETTATSDPFVITEPSKRLRVINYVAEQTPLPDPGQGFGTISGTILYCTSPDRAEGEVDFFVRTESFMTAAITSECTTGGGTSGGSIFLYPADPDTGEIDPAGVTALWTDGIEFWQDIIPSGYYVLGYVSPYSGEETLSQPFTIAHRAETTVDINVYSEPAYLTYLDVWKDICVDPDRAGETSFQMITEWSLAAADESVFDCRYSTPDDGEYTFTLTNLDTGQTWERTVAGGEGLTFDNLVAGTYTLSETHEGVTATSEPFVLDPSIGIWHWMNVRNFIAEKDWSEPEPGEDVAYIGIFAYYCIDGGRNGGYEWYRHAPVVTGPTLTAMADEAIPEPSPTSNCFTIGEAEGIGFTAERADGTGEPIEFFENGPGLFEIWPPYGIPAGDYIITETATGATSGVVTIVGWTGMRFLLFEDQPQGEVTLEIESANPAVADTIPAGSTWAVTNVDYPQFGASGTFDGAVTLPATIPLDEPLPYGDYRVEIDASPDFELYSEVFTLGPQELMSTQLYGMLQQLPGAVTWNIVLQPVDQAPETPTPTVPGTPEPTEPTTPVPTDPVTPEPTVPVTPEPTSSDTDEGTATPETEVTGLPSTGNGDNGSREGWMLLAAAMGAVLAGASGFVVRQKRG